MRQILKDKVTVGQAAAIIGVHESRVRILADRGDLPSARGPFRMRFLNRASVEEYAARRKSRSQQRALVNT